MAKFIRITFFVVCLMLSMQNSLYAQQVIQNQGFTHIPTLNNKAILLKEITLNNVSEAAMNYTKLKNWVKSNYTTDLINSSIIYYNDDQAVLVKSRVSLLLPLLNEQNISEKSLMSYHLYIFIRNGKCVMQISEIDYKVENAIPALKKKIKAEDFVTDEALLVNDQYRKERIETQKGTLYFFNEQANSLEKALNGNSGN